MASYAQSFRYTTARYNVSRTRIDMVRRPAVSGLRAAFKEGEERIGREGAESPVDPYMMRIVGANGTEKERSHPEHDPETSWYDDSISEDGEGDGRQNGGLEGGEQEVFELEGDLPTYPHIMQGAEPGPHSALFQGPQAMFELEGDFSDTPHQPQLLARRLHDTVFELEAVETFHPHENRTDTCRSRRHSFPDCQRYSCLNHALWDGGIYHLPPIWTWPDYGDLEQIARGNLKERTEHLRYWLASDNHPEWKFDAASEQENIRDVSQLDRVEKQLRRSLSFTRRRGNEVWNRVRPRARSGSVASFFHSSLITVGGLSTLQPTIRRLALCGRNSVGQV